MVLLVGAAGILLIGVCRIFTHGCGGSEDHMAETLLEEIVH